MNGEHRAINPNGKSTPALIRQVCSEIAELLCRKNLVYGDSALNPVRIFSKADRLEQINVRLDDKLSRLARGSDAGEDVELDLLGHSGAEAGGAVASTRGGVTMANPPIPTNIRAINGNPGKRALTSPGEPDPDYLVDLTPPPFLSGDRAREVWDYLAPKLAKAKLLCEVDVITFARYCEDVAECFQGQQIVTEFLARGEMPIVEGLKGGFNYHPAVVIRNRAAERMDKGAAHFGLSPMGRTRIKTQPQGDLFGNDFESFLRSVA